MASWSIKNKKKRYFLLWLFLTQYNPTNELYTIIRLHLFGYNNLATSSFKCPPRHHFSFFNNTHIFFLNYWNSIFFKLHFQISIHLNFHTQVWYFMINKWLIIKNRVNFFVYRHFENEALFSSPRQPSMESRIWRPEKLKLVSNGNITNKIPFLDVYGDINLVVTWSNLP